MQSFTQHQLFSLYGWVRREENVCESINMLPKAQTMSAGPEWISFVLFG